MQEKATEEVLKNITNPDQSFKARFTTIVTNFLSSNEPLENLPGILQQFGFSEAETVALMQMIELKKRLRNENIVSKQKFNIGGGDEKELEANIINGHKFILSYGGKESDWLTSPIHQIIGCIDERCNRGIGIAGNGALLNSHELEGVTGSLLWSLIEECKEGGVINIEKLNALRLAVGNRPLFQVRPHEYCGAASLYLESRFSL
jgi:hypothetical protein